MDTKIILELVGQGGLAVTVAILLLILREVWAGYKRKDAVIEQILPLAVELSAATVDVNETAQRLATALAVENDRRRG